MCVNDRISRWSTPTGAWRCSCGCWTGPLDQRFASLPRLQSSTLAGWCSRRTRMRACLRLCTSSLQLSLYPPGALCLLCPVFAFKYSRLSSFCIQIFTFALARTGTHTPTPNSGKQQSGYAASEWQADAAAKLAALCDDASATENAKKYASGALKLVAASIGKAPLVNKGLI